MLEHKNDYKTISIAKSTELHNWHRTEMGITTGLRNHSVALLEQLFTLDILGRYKKHGEID